MRNEVIISDLASVFQPSQAIAPIGDKAHWRKVPYRSGKIEGTLLSSLGTGRPDDVSFDPKLTGWYRVYVAIPNVASSELHLKLTKDPGFFKIIPLHAYDCALFLEESLWRCCDMTGQSITISKANMNEVKEPRSMLAWLRFVPMEEAEVEAYLADVARQDTKRIYATDDMHNRLCWDIIDRPGVWDGVLLPYEASDVEWLSLEDIACFTRGEIPTDRIEDFSFIRSVDKMVQTQAAEYDSIKVLSHLVKNGREKGIKMSVSLRMGAWTMGFPYDQCYFDNAFYFDNPHLRCVGREGTPIASLSYAFEEVQDYIINRLVTLAATGCDAVTLISHRGGPYMLFEKPVADRFFAAYGIYPYTLPLDDPRLNGIHCQIMTEFFQKLRNALDKTYPERRVDIHLRTQWSVYDTQYYAMDCEDLAKKGLVDALIVYPLRYREIIDPEFCQDGVIDLDAYRNFVEMKAPRPFIRNYDSATCYPPYPDSAGVPRGPETTAQCVREWMALEHQYDVKVYMEIMPRIMEPETMRQRALELYDAGAERIGLWDTYSRASRNAMWTLTRKLGHKEELKAMKEPYYQIHRIHEIIGMDISRNHPSWGG